MIDPLRTLIVEDSESDANLLLALLKRSGFRVEHERVETEATMRSAFARRSWDVVICDWSMPTFSATAALAVVREVACDVPFIIVSGTVGEEHAVAAMRAGANDYMSKDKLGRLVPAIEREMRERETRRAHRATELARLEAELRFKRLCDSGISGVVVAERTGLILEANDVFLEMVGYTREDLERGLLDGMRMTPDDWVDPTGLAIEELAREGRTRPYEKEYLRKDGTRIPVLIGAAALDEIRVLAVVTDLSARNRALEAQAALEEQLRQAQKMEAIGRLAGGVAHDFNNLLSVVLGYSELLIADLKKGDPMLTDIAEIRNAGLRAADLTRQLLMFSRQQVIEPKVIALNDLLTGMERMLRRIVGEDVTLTTSCGARVSRVYVDPGSMEQVVMNLAVNARDAMPTGGALTMETSNVVLDADDRQLVNAAPGRYVVLSVTDEGSGMDDATKARIFEPFFTTKEVGKGTGLGLATVFGIVQQSGGHLSVSSSTGKGASFKVFLPCVEAPLGATTSPPSPIVRGDETILLVEDDDPVREVARGILRRHGYDVIEARNAGEALLCAERRAGTIHLLLTDVVMPQMSGPELARRLHTSRPEMRVLCVSGYTDDATVRHGVGADIAYMQKPFTVESLTRKVRDVLDAR